MVRSSNLLMLNKASWLLTAVDVVFTRKHRRRCPLMMSFRAVWSSSVCIFHCLLQLKYAIAFDFIVSNKFDVSVRTMLLRTGIKPVTPVLYIISSVLYMTIDMT